MTAKPVAAALKQARFTQMERDFVYKVALKYLKDKDAAHDVAQDALLLAFRHQHSYRGEARFTTWLYRVAATSALMHLRRARRRPPALLLSLVEAAAPDETCAAQPSPEELLSSDETLALCECLVAEMGVMYAPLLHLRFVKGWSDVEIAKKLGLNLGAVKTRVYRVRTHLRRRLVQLGLKPRLPAPTNRRRRQVRPEAGAETTRPRAATVFDQPHQLEGRFAAVKAATTSY
ncbi:MAG TPA: sigma-70 family RNA polymerase sigma factor [Polyangia bacterium]